MKLSPRTTITFTLGLLTVGLLAGCGGQTTVAHGEMSIQTSAAVREAAPLPSPSASPSPEEAWGMLGVNLQLVNNSGRAINVLSKRSDSSLRLGDIPNGGTASVEGTFAIGYDVEVNVDFLDGTKFTLSAANTANSPIVKTCTGESEFKENEQQDYNFHDHGITIKRLFDDDWKQFLVTFTPTVPKFARDETC